MNRPTPITTSAFGSIFPNGVPETHAEAFMRCVRLEQERALLIEALRAVETSHVSQYGKDRGICYVRPDTYAKVQALLRELVEAE